MLRSRLSVIGAVLAAILALDLAQAAAGSVPSVLSVVSHKTHGTVGDLGINVSSPCAVESRKNGPTQVVVTFNQAIQQLNGTVEDVQVDQSSKGTVTSVSVNDVTLTVGLEGATGPQTLQLSFPGIADATDAAAVVTQTIWFRVLAGDTSGDGTITLADAQDVQRHVGQPVDSSNYPLDLDANGAITMGDYTLAQRSVGKTTGACEPYAMASLSGAVGAEPSVVAAVSRKTHGAAGEFDINVSNPNAVEGRKNGPTLVIVTLDKAVALDGTPCPVQVSQGMVESLSISDNLLTLGLSGAVEPETLTISLPGIADAADLAATMTQALSFEVLFGDATGDGLVNTFDDIAVRGQMGHAVDASNFQIDLNADGVFNTSDYIPLR